MENKGKRFKFFNKTTIQIIGILLVILSAIILLWQGNKNSNQSIPATPAQIYFVGQYQIGDGELQDIVEGKHISSTKGDVTLIGNFHMLTPSGEYIGVFKGSTPIAFYTDHINLTFYEDDGEPYVIDHENPLFKESACGVDWTAHSFTSGTQTVKIVIHNPHKFGNENAIDKMLENVAFWGDIEFEKGILDAGETQRNVGVLFIIVSIMFLGTAVFSTLIHIKNNKFIWLLGLVVLFAGAYFIYSSMGISFWGASVVSNTILLGASMILYAFFLSILITRTFKHTRKIGDITCIALGVANALVFIISMTIKVYFFDALMVWVIIQNVASALLIGCLIKEMIKGSKKERLISIGATLPLVFIGLDAIANAIGLFEGAVLSQFIFIILLIVAMVVVIRIIPSSINALTKAKELEREKLLLNNELTQSRVSTMMSQIRPHFIYNTLGSIEQLCEIDPPKAGELVHNFAKYLRGNFGELDNPKPILMSKEMEHVHHYISIENVRFPDMTFTFEMNSSDFNIPALSIQPIVENAIKHGLMKLSKGGTIRVVSYETEDSYCVSVEDDGVGFDTSVLLDERKHVGIRNIRGRLKAMVNGTLEIESKIGEGTKVLITIPKGDKA